MKPYSYQALRDNPDMPTPRGIALEILRLARQPDTSVQDVASVIQMDPALASRLIRAVNAPAMGVGRHISSIPQAASLLGLRAVMHIALGFCIVGEVRDDAPWGYSFQRFWAASLGRATALRRLACYLKEYTPEEAFTFGLLSRIGELALACLMKDRYMLVLRSATEDDVVALLRAERQAFGVDHILLSADLMGDWGLPPNICDAVRAESQRILPPSPQHEPPRPQNGLATLLRLTDHIGTVLGNRSVGRDYLRDMIRCAQEAGVEPLDFIDLFDHITEDWREAGKLFAIPTVNVPSIPELYARANDARQAWGRRSNHSNQTNSASADHPKSVNASPRARIFS